ncbi:MAG: regulatory protein RecX [Selenomonadaceae bacterium]|nr:regulatory protein RecX [Selenomonadaceae bacterium]
MIQKNKTALQRAADLLARQEQSEKVLRKKLLLRKYETEEIDAAIDKLKKYKYLNDEETCANMFENLYAEERLSVKQICLKLIQRGYDSDFIQNLIPADTYQHEYNAALKIAVKKFAGNNSADLKFKQKFWQHLASKGFDSEIIGAVFKDLNCNGN